MVFPRATTALRSVFHHTILSERWQPRTVEQLVDMIVSQVMDKIVEVGRLADRPPSRAAHREIVKLSKISHKNVVRKGWWSGT